MSNINLDPTAIRVLLSGFGPTQRFKENPSWLAVEPLHNTILIADPPVDPNAPEQPIITDEMEAMATRSQQIHITALQIPSTYQAILSIVPALHARPPILPIKTDNLPPPPPDGYDFMFHIGVIGRGPLRMEKLSHRTGYRMKDADDQYAPVIPPLKDAPRDVPEPNPMEEMHRLMLESIASEQTTSVSGLHAELPMDSPDHIQRGFGKPMYDNCPDELNTEIDVAKLIHHLKESGIENVYSSMDAGHYVSDFCMYCSLAESKRAALKQEKSKERSTPPKSTPVLFMHCPPVGQPLTTEEVTDAIKKIILWVCARPQP